MSKVISFTRGKDHIGYFCRLSEGGILSVAGSRFSAKCYNSDMKFEMAADLERLRKAFPYNNFVIETA